MLSTKGTNSPEGNGFKLVIGVELMYGEEQEDASHSSQEIGGTLLQLDHSFGASAEGSSAKDYERLVRGGTMGLEGRETGEDGIVDRI